MLLLLDTYVTTYGLMSLKAGSGHGPVGRCG